MNNKLDIRLAVARFNFLNSKEKKILELNLDNMHQIALLSIEDISIIIQRAVKPKIWNPKVIPALVERDKALARLHNIGFLFNDNANWPFLLNEIWDSPYMLYYRGNSDILLKPAIAIVGTRKPTGRGIEASERLAAELAYCGFVVVSGLAMGIDAAAHRGALMKNNEGTIAVLGTGVDTISPAINKRLGGQILSQGSCIISEFAPAESGATWHFPKRNRIISALSQATIVIEAPAGSGALITADFAIEHNRELLFHEQALKYEKLYQQQAMAVSGKKKKSSVSSYIEDGAKIVKNAEDVIRYLNSENEKIKKDNNLF